MSGGGGRGEGCRLIVWLKYQGLGPGATPAGSYTPNPYWELQPQIPARVAHCNGCRGIADGAMWKQGAAPSQMANKNFNFFFNIFQIPDEFRVMQVMD